MQVRQLLAKGRRPKCETQQVLRLAAHAQRVEVDAEELRIMGTKSELLRTLVAASSPKTAGFGVPSSVPKWRTTLDSSVVKVRARRSGPPFALHLGSLGTCRSRRVSIGSRRAKFDDGRYCVAVAL